MKRVQALAYIFAHRLLIDFRKERISLAFLIMIAQQFHAADDLTHCLKALANTTVQSGKMSL